MKFKITNATIDQTYLRLAGRCSFAGVVFPAPALHRPACQDLTGMLPQLLSSSSLNQLCRAHSRMILSAGPSLRPFLLSFSETNPARLPPSGTTSISFAGRGRKSNW